MKLTAINLLILTGFVIGWLVNFIGDIAIYYAVISLSSVALASIGLLSIKTSRDCALTYSILTLVQSAITFLLIFDLGYIGNTVAQYVLIKFNDILYLTLLIIGLIESGIFSTLSSNSATGSHIANSGSRNNHND